MSDTEEALLALRAYYAKYIGEPSVPRLLLQSQIYATVKDRTQVDRELVRIRDFLGLIFVVKKPRVLAGLALLSS